jgi:hypothetical protein
MIMQSGSFALFVLGLDSVGDFIDDNDGGHSPRTIRNVVEEGVLGQSPRRAVASKRIRIARRRVEPRRSEGTCFSSPNDYGVGGFKARSARSERSERSNQAQSSLDRKTIAAGM